MDFITLHRSVAREAFYPSAQEKPFFFDPVIKAWVVAGARRCEEFLLSPNLAVVPYHPAYEDMAKRNPNFAFANLLFAFKYIPLCLNGSEHAFARRKIAQYMASRKLDVAAAIPGLVESRFGALATCNRIELVREAIEPLVKDVLCALNEIYEIDRSVMHSPSAVFDRMMSAKRRRALDSDLAKIRESIRHARGADLTEEDEGFSLALMILGTDALAGTLGESLHQVLTANQGLRLSEIEFPSTPTATGVPLVERVVTEPFEYEGIMLEKGARVRLMLQSFQYSPEARMRMFGAGIHVCLGRQMSLDVWSHITRLLSGIDARVRIVDYTLRDDDYVFTYPSNFVIELER